MRLFTLSAIRPLLVVFGLLLASGPSLASASSSQDLSTQAQSAPGNDQGTKGTGSAG